MSSTGPGRGGSDSEISTSAVLPAHFHNPFGLLARVLRTGDASAYYALGTAAATALLTPIDWVLERGEIELYERAPETGRPPLFVAGPPRSGTTLTFQSLVHAFDVAYPTNLIAMFPRSPIRAAGIRRQPFRNAAVALESYYGRTRHWYGTNDVLHLWDRWLDPDRRRVTRSIPETRADAMRRFFTAFDAALGRPLVMKNNSLNTCAGVVGAALPGSVFLILERDPFFLAQALLLARRAIHGDEEAVYGVDDAERPHSADPVEDVALQVAFHRQATREQASRLPADRLRVISYEKFCAQPMTVLGEIGERMGYGPPLRDVPAQAASSTVRIDDETARRLRDALKAADADG